MKIHGQGSDPIAAALEGVGRSSPAVGKATGKPAQAATGAGADQLTLSTEAQALLAATRAEETSAADAASDVKPVEAPPIRRDRVEAMKAAMARGEVGNNPEQIADALLDHWITKG